MTVDTVPICESCGAELQHHPAFESGARHAARLHDAFKAMKVTTIGPDRGVPEGTKIWFLFEDEVDAALADDML